MTEQMPLPLQLRSHVLHYLGLESMEVTEALLDMCGASIDARALSLLKQRLQEEKEQIPLLMAHGYIRMSEKSKQLVESLTLLISLLEQTILESNT